MIKKHKILTVGLLALIMALVAGVGSYALAQTGGGQQPAAAGKVASRHADYSVSLQVNGNLSQVNPKPQGILPLDLTAKGGVDIQKDSNGVSAKGDVQLGGLDQIIQKVIATRGSGNGSAAMGSLVSGAISDLNFVEVDHHMYVQVAGTWYDVTSGCKPSGKPGSAPADKAADKAKVQSLIPSGPKSLLSNVQTSADTIDGVSTTHYSATVDVNKAIDDAIAALNSKGKTAQAGQLQADRSQIVAAAKQLDLEWWMDGSGQLRQVKVAVEIDPSGLASLVPSANGKGKLADVLKGITSVKLDATVKFSQFGTDFQIAKPDGNILQLKDLMGLAGLTGHKAGFNPAAHNHRSGNHAPAPASH